ncbi:MAG: cell envelope integrity protein TolA [Betaproteobacteria bacterium]|nr:cell envelope integrity protein TolA [Betaproteobacteria bacterium]
MTAQHPADPFRPRSLAGLRSGALMALLVHGGLVVALSLAVNWRRSEPAPVMAELWSVTAQEAAPAEQAPPPAEPAAEPERPSPPPPTPAPKEPDMQADIAMKKASEAKEREREKEKERERERERQMEKQRQKERQQEREKQKERERLKAEKAAEERAEAQRQENLARIKGMAGASGGAEATGSTAQSSGPSAGYAGRIKARIKPLIVYPDSLPGNPVAELEVRLAPSGAIVGQRLLRKSDSPEWDAAVIRAVEKAEMLPRDIDGRVPPVIVIQFSRRE